MVHERFMRNVQTAVKNSMCTKGVLKLFTKDTRIWSIEINLLLLLMNDFRSGLPYIINIIKKCILNKKKNH